MAKKGNAKKSKKGPKGKKARAKAKLDRQWGEQVINVPTKPARGGKSKPNSRHNRERSGEDVGVDVDVDVD
eukprot:CAMPEP_0202472060 /NCGR_PEP_ID=MMETSP1360-20130828/86573_1 /ASSEMBLY_ACC=CAM_ASM_000848 /TAXON_ID=515479 /ORGANISM="Licmophora paradoxa, Strain CCMP2313" /LENGTH=70 /DNA_ID=CAMNT_0049098365 /DNA_START=42 /DNA_END=251 /DNA_ORIENTATION=+